MPSGYTQTLHDGDQSFEDYALGVARAFGALITMRDEPQNAQIPEKFEPTSYAQNALNAARAARDRFLAMPDEEIAAYQVTKRASAQARRDEYVRDRNARRARYEAMLKEARAYKPPTPDHENFARMLVEQLEESIRFDCGSYEPEVPGLLAADEYRNLQVAKAEKDIAYYEAEHAKDVRRAEERTAWVRELRRSLASREKREPTPEQVERVREIHQAKRAVRGPEPSHLPKEGDHAS